jgi:hypothetical protein
VVTLAAVIVGGRAAASAAQTYALEAEPVIVVRELTAIEDLASTEETKRRVSASTRYVVAGSPTLSDGVTLRQYGVTREFGLYSTLRVSDARRRSP